MIRSWEKYKLIFHKTKIQIVVEWSLENPIRQE